MYHTFSSRDGGGPKPNPSEAGTGTPVRRFNKSCSECTRRKVKCDGGYPCGSCWYYKIPEACVYKQRSKRQAASRV